MLSLIYELPEEVAKDERWKNEALWPLVNPHLGRSVDMDYLRDELRKAEDEGPESMALVASQHFNVQVGSGLHDDRWVGADYWSKAARSDLTLDEIIETSEVCVVGMDGGGLDDLLGLCVMGRHAETKVWQVWVKAWADRDVLKLRKNISQELEEFDESGDLTLVDNIEDQANPEIIEICRRLKDAGRLPETGSIGMDPGGVGTIIDDLTDAGFKIDDIHSISQGIFLKSAIKFTPSKLKYGTIVHCGQKLMDWCVGNAKTEAYGNAVIVTKKQSGSAKIDPLMAMFNAVMLMSSDPKARAGVDDFLARPVMAMN